MVNKNIIVTLFVTAAGRSFNRGLPRKLLTTLREPANYYVPGYFADRTNKKFGDTSLIYMLLPMVAEPVWDRHLLVQQGFFKKLDLDADQSEDSH